MEPGDTQNQRFSQGEGNVSPGDSVAFDPANLFQQAADSSGLNQKPSSGRGGWEPPLPAEMGQWFPGMEIIDVIGRGGMGAVYKAVQRSLGRTVAIKLLPEELSQNPEFAERFKREAKALGALEHPNIVTIHNFGVTKAGHHFFVMEYVDGTDFHQYIQSGRLTVDRAFAAIIQICDALQYAHKKGFVHRDIKPGNIFIDRAGLIKVGDFGLAKIVREKSDTFDPGLLTGTGVGMGTIFYSAPEQLQGRAVDHRADIYSLGVMLYEMLTHQLPQGIFKMPSEKVRVDARIDEVVLLAIQEDPNQRYQNVTEVQSDLNLIQKGPDSGPLPKSIRPKTAPPKNEFPLWQVLAISLGFAILFAMAGIVAWGYFSNKEENPDPAPVVTMVPTPRPATPPNRNSLPDKQPSEIVRKFSSTQPAIVTPVNETRPVVNPPEKKVIAPVKSVSRSEVLRPIPDAVLSLLDIQYLSALERARDSARAANQTNLTRLLSEEVVKIKSGKKIPATDPPETNDRLVSLRNIWRSEMAKGIPLINGRDLEGWSGVEPNTWKVVEGAIWGRKGALISQLIPFRHYEMSGEIFVSESGNGGIFLLGPNSPEATYWQEEALEFSIVGSEAFESGGVWTGGFIETNTRGLPNFETPDTNLIRNSGWSPFRIRVTKEALESWIGGRFAARMPLYNPEKGVSHIGLEAKNSLVGYRDLRIKEIDE